MKKFWNKFFMMVVSIMLVANLAACGSSVDEANDDVVSDEAITDVQNTESDEVVSSEEDSTISDETEHKHNYTETVTVEPTCVNDGTKSFVCECGYTYEEKIASKGHDFGEYTSNGDATLKTDGTKTATCATCGTTDTIVDEGSKLTYTYTEMSATMWAKSSVNVRNLPSTDGEKLGGLSAGQEVKVTGQCNETGWYRISYNGGEAFVSNSYLVNTKPEDPKPEEPSQPDEPGECPVTMYQLFDEGDYIYCYVDSFHLINPTSDEIAKRDAVISKGNYLALTRWNGNVQHYICREEFMWGNRTICLVEWLPK